MWKSEASLKNENIMPVFSGLFSNNKLSWVIYHPKIGYKYRLYFTLKKKIESAGSKRNTVTRNLILG